MTEQAPSLPKLEALLAHEDGFVDNAMAVALWGAGVCWIVPMMSSMMLVGALVDSDKTEWLNRLYCRGQVALTGAAYKTVVADGIDPNQAYLFACNHVNILDHVTMYPSTPHFKQGIELAKHFKIPVYGWFMKQRGTIAVHRGQGRIEQLRESMRAEQQKGHSILGFPEGTRTRTGRVQPFRRGLFKMARDLNMPVIPTTVTGMFEIKRPGDWRLRRGKEVTVYCDAPMDPSGLADDEIQAFANRVQGVISDRVDDYWRRS